MGALVTVGFWGFVIYLLFKHGGTMTKVVSIFLAVAFLFVLAGCSLSGGPKGYYNMQTLEQSVTEKYNEAPGAQATGFTCIRTGNQTAACNGQASYGTTTMGVTEEVWIAENGQSWISKGSI